MEMPEGKLADLGMVVSYWCKVYMKKSNGVSGCIKIGIFSTDMEIVI